MRDFPHTRTGHDDHEKVLPGNPCFPCGFLDHGLAIRTDSENPFVVDNDELPIVVRVLLHFVGLFGPLEVVGQALFQFAHLAELHDVFSGQNGS